VNERQLAHHLGCDRTTVLRMIRELERDGLLQRLRRRGRKGLVVKIHKRN
jgi:DNA-binding GntR family transcriptional regulator